MGAPTVSNFQILCEWLSDLISLLVVLVTNHGSLRVYRGMTIFSDNSLATICCTSLKVTFRGLKRFVSVPPLHPRSIDLSIVDSSTRLFSSTRPCRAQLDERLQALRLLANAFVIDFRNLVEF